MRAILKNLALETLGLLTFFIGTLLVLFCVPCTALNLYPTTRKHARKATNILYGRFQPEQGTRLSAHGSIA